VTTGNLFELAIIAFIVFGITLAAWRGGARNPVATGGLDRKIGVLAGEVKAVTGRLGDLTERVEKIEGNFASAADIKRLEKAIERLASKQADHESRQRVLAEKQSEHAAISAGTAAKVDQIDKNLALILSVVVPRGMEK
jgi:hypothetical protein